MRYRINMDRGRAQISEVARDGTERDISGHVTGFEIWSHEGSNRITLHSAVSGELDITNASAVLLHSGCDHCDGHPVRAPLGTDDPR